MQPLTVLSTVQSGGTTVVQVASAPRVFIMTAMRGFARDVLLTGRRQFPCITVNGILPYFEIYFILIVRLKRIVCNNSSYDVYDSNTQVQAGT